MVCLYCGGATRVTNSRSQKRANNTWRRRTCTDCEAMFTTIEQPDLSKSLVVTYPSGAFSGFQRDQLLLDIHAAVLHRKTAQNDATALTDTVIARILPQSSHGSITTIQIIEIVQQTLSAFDHAAATHYTAYHPVTSRKGV
jgi:transcriptional regulator NrdR family protein